MITLKNVKKVFDQNGHVCTALDDINLHVPEGSVYGVIGCSGAGKSTLIRCINLLEQPTCGEVIVDGQNLVDLTARQLSCFRRRIGMIFQHFNLLSNKTVYDNIALPLALTGKNKEEIAQAVEPLINRVGLTNKKCQYPAQLSGGQQQRVAIARALASHPKVLLCDEATSALDPQTTQTILTLLKKINQDLNITILLITHEMDVIQSVCDRVAVISAGRVVEHNTVKQFFLSPQTEPAQEFVRSAIHEKSLTALTQQCRTVPFEGKNPDRGKNPIVRITFDGDKTVQPLITQVARQFDTDFVILQADLESLDGYLIGFLMVEVMGKPESVQLALAFLQERVKVEVLGYVH
ncbi:Methionine import ATP-binding protein MetN [invertebrate metagenome]|uniref:Methionine import ATP-binding protein MetN n=1 Tax=invertebrate metagenome TaxID=1711999 RepID=A0A2H9T978_9ZZZZ